MSINLDCNISFPDPPLQMMDRYEYVRTETTVENFIHPAIGVGGAAALGNYQLRYTDESLSRILVGFGIRFQMSQFHLQQDWATLIVWNISQGNFDFANFTGGVVFPAGQIGPQLALLPAMAAFVRDNPNYIVTQPVSIFGDWAVPQPVVPPADIAYPIPLNVTEHYRTNIALDLRNKLFLNVWSINNTITLFVRMWLMWFVVKPKIITGAI